MYGYPSGFSKKKSNKEVAVASFTFTPPTNVLKAVPMIQAVLPSGFANVYNVTLIQTNPTVNALVVDSVGYTAST